MQTEEDDHRNTDRLHQTPKIIKKKITFNAAYTKTGLV